MSRRKTICFLTVSPESPHAQRLCQGIFAQCEKYGYNIAQFASMTNLDFYFKDYKQAEENIYHLPCFERFDGVILDTISLMEGNSQRLVDMVYERVVASKKPVVCIGIPYKELRAVTNSNETQIREICRHAIEVHGCRDILILTGIKGNHEAEERLEIMLDEIKAHGLAVSDEHIVYGDFWYNSGIQLAHDIIESRISKPDAIIAASDHMALGFIEEYTKLGGRVPEDICVLGFEATPEAALNDISLTSIESNFAKCAADAVDILRSEIEPEQPILPYEPDAHKMLHIAMSCGCTPDIHRTLAKMKSSIYFMARNYNEDIFNDNVDIGLLMENYIPEQLTASKDPDECIENIFKMTYIISPFASFYLCLKDDWLNLGRDITEGYPEKMRVVLKSGEELDKNFWTMQQSVLFDTKEMLPQMYEEHDEPFAYYFSAVHFSDKTLGYAVLQRRLKDYSKFNLVYRNWLRFVNTSLEMARSKNQYVMMSIHDKMTGLLNRRGMYEQLERLSADKGDDSLVFACVIDMDGLKYINDTFGHLEGDFGIIKVSEAVTAIALDGDVCARAGGDEFYIAGIRDKGSFDIESYTKDFCEKLAALSESSGKPFPITASIGCASAESCKDVDFEALFSEADENMYRFKMMRKRHRI